MNPLNNVYVRLAIYMGSLLIGAIPAAWAGWLTAEIVEGWLHVHIKIEGALTAVTTALGLSGGIFAKWGSR
jgi:hypothetical protein